MEKLKKSQLNRVVAPKGFKFRMVPPDGPGCYTYCRLYDKAHPEIGYIGQISLEPYAGDKFVTHSRLNDAYHGRGLGTLLYARAIQWCLDNGHKVASSYSPSYLAQRVWNGSSLRRFFSIKKESYCHWEVIKQKKKPVEKKPVAKKAAKKTVKKTVKKAVKRAKPRARKRTR